MSSREGNVLKLKDILEQIDSKLNGITNKETVSNLILYVFDLKNDYDKDIKFNVNLIDKGDFKGDNGLYIIYTYVRWYRIFNMYLSNSELKEEDFIIDINSLNFGSEENNELFKEIYKIFLKYYYILEKSINNKKINNIILYLLELSHIMNKLYSNIVIKKLDSINKKVIYSILMVYFKILEDIFFLFGIEMDDLPYSI